MNSFGDLLTSIRRAHYVNDADKLLEIAETLEQSGEPVWQAEAMAARGLADEVHGDMDEAIAKLQTALDMFTKTGDAEGMARTHFRLGKTYTEVGSFEKAMACYEAFRNVSQELGNKEDVLLATNNIGISHFYTSHTNEALKVWREALVQAEALHDKGTETALTLNIGNALSNLGESPDAMAQYRRALDLNAAGENSEHVAALAYYNLGILYFYTGLYPDAMEAWNKAIELYEQLGDLRALADIKVNFGNLHSALGDYGVSLSYFDEAIAVLERNNARPSLANAYTCKGNVIQSNGQVDEAIALYQKAITIYADLDVYDHTVRLRSTLAELFLDEHRIEEAAEQLRDLDAARCGDIKTTIYLLLIRGNLHEQTSDPVSAQQQYEKALALAASAGLRPDESRAHYRLRELARAQGDLEAYIRHNDAKVKIDEESSGRDATLKIAMIEKQKELAVIERERERERAVLYSTLPDHVADRLIRGEEVTDHFEMASVIFVDIVGFTTISDKIPAGHVVHLLKAIFKVCDDVCDRHQVTKVKTIGDSYMAVAGVPEPLADHAQRAAAAALEMMKGLNELELTMDPALGDTSWTKDVGEIQVRIGLHCGPVVAGVVGDERLQYDVWGDTVNTASRMESTSEPGRIQCSDVFMRSFADAQDDAGTRHSLERSDEGPLFIKRGEVDIKGKGSMTTYWLDAQ